MTRTTHRTKAFITTVLLIATSIQAFAQQSGVLEVVYWQTGHQFESGSGSRNDQRFIAFNAPFASTPTINLGLKRLDVDKNTAVRFDFNSVQVTPNGFFINLATWADTKIYSIGVSWFAYTV